MNIVHIVLNDYRPDKRVHKAASLAAKRGHAVTVLATNRAGTEKTNEVIDGVNVIRISGLLGFPWKSIFLLFNLLVTIIQIKKQSNQIKPDLFHIHDLSGLAAGVLLLFGRTPVVYDAHEYFSQDYLALSMPKFLSGIARYIHQLLASKADAYITVGELIAQRMRSELNCEDVYVVRNVPDIRANKLTNISLKSLFPDIPSPYIVIHIGRTESGRDLNGLLNGFEQSNSRSCLVFLGASDALMEKVNELPDNFRQRVACIPTVPAAEVTSIAAQADCGVVWFNDGCENFRLALPNKIFDCLSVGIPLLVNDLPAMSDFVGKTGVGAVFSTDGHDLPLKINHMSNLNDEEKLKLSKAIKVQSELSCWECESKFLYDAYKSLGFNI